MHQAGGDGPARPRGERSGGARDDGGRDETPDERADRNFSDILQELRVVLTGTQLISGFLLAVAFQSGFRDLDADEATALLDGAIGIGDGPFEAADLVVEEIRG